MKAETKDSSDFIKKKKRKKQFKKATIIIILFTITAVILLLKLPYFNVSKILVTNNINLSNESIITISGIENGNNIFYINGNAAKNLLLKNPYIEKVSIKRILPSTINIEVNERKIMYYYKDNGNYLVIANDGTLIEKREQISKMKLVELSGFEFGASQVGEKLRSDETRKFEAINQIGEIILNNKTEHVITKVDVSDVLNIKIYFENICVKIGTIENVKEKLNMAINILSQNDFKAMKGYIDVSFNGNPVFFIQK